MTEVCSVHGTALYTRYKRLPFHSAFSDEHDDDDDDTTQDGFVFFFPPSRTPFQLQVGVWCHVNLQVRDILCVRLPSFSSLVWGGGAEIN